MTETADLFVLVPGGEVFVRTWVPSVLTQEIPLVLLHDSLGSVELWRDFPAALADSTGRKVIAYDRLGFGKSSLLTQRPPRSFIWDEGAMHLPALLERLEIEEFCLLGYSVGGSMALCAAAAHPARCRAVVTIAAQMFVEDRTLRGIEAAMERFAKPEAMARLEKWHGPRAGWILDAWFEVWRAPDYQDWSMTETLPGVRCPVLAIHGDQDEFGSVAFLELIRDRSGGPVEVVVMEGCGHMPQRERREETLALVKEFLEQAP